MYNINDNASVCVLNYFHDFGYCGNINDICNISTFDNCEYPLYFVKRLEDLKLEAGIVTMRIEDMAKTKKDEFPLFTICELEKRETFYLPIYKIDNEFVTIKDSNCFNRRIKIDDFNKLYEGKVIKITNNKEFLKHYFLKNDLKKKRLVGLSLIFSLTFVVVFLTLFIAFLSINQKINIQTGIFLTLSLVFLVPTFILAYSFDSIRKTIKRKSTMRDPNKSYYKKHYDMPKDGTKVKSDSNLLYGLEMAADVLEVICDIISIFK